MKATALPWPLDGDRGRERVTRDRKVLVSLEGLSKPSKWITLNCYKVLSATGELEAPDGRALEKL